MAQRVLAVALVAALAGGASTVRAESWPATITVAVDQPEQRVWPEILGINLNPGAGPAAVSDPQTVNSVRYARIASVRFPNGCVADRYNWKGVDDTKQISVDQFLAFCEAVGAEPYYTLNLQGGTENLEGPPPENAPLEETISYRHTAPNPCGNTNYHFGTVAEAEELVERYTVQRALDGKSPILSYEMGNENWGQATTDWPPEVYGATVAAYARAITNVVARARREHSALADLKLYIVAVGYPLVGNNQDPTQAMNHDLNVRWTREMNRLKRDGHIDAVQDHFYPYSNIGTDYLIWSHFNLTNILSARRGVANPLLDGYRSEELTFHMPIEITEWNGKCWGERKKCVTVRNPDFEEGLGGWRVDAASAESAESSTPPSVLVFGDAGRRGQGLRVDAGDGKNVVQRVWQMVDWKKTPANQVTAVAWMRSDKPTSASLRLVPVDAEGRPDWSIEEGKAVGWRAGHWQRIITSLKLDEKATRFAVGFEVRSCPQVEDALSHADFDALEVFFWNAERGMNPAAVDTAARSLFVLDAFRIMIEHGIRRAHLHHLFGNYPCGMMGTDGQTKDTYQVFCFLAGQLGTHTVTTQVQGPTFDFASYADTWATPFNAVAPSVENVPVLSALGMSDDLYVYVLAVNRSTDQKVVVAIDIQGAVVKPVGSVRRLLCEDFDLGGVRLTQKHVRLDDGRLQEIGPHSAALFRFERVTSEQP